MKMSGWPEIVACASADCGGANFHHFRFCQWCGSPRLVLYYDPLEGTSQIHDADIDKRRSELLHMAASKQHARAKCKELEALQLFLRTRNTSTLRKLDVFAAHPRDIVDFVISRDLEGLGRTLVHSETCNSRLTSGDCGCPRRLSAETVRTLVSKLKSKFYELGCCGPWNQSTCTGNPADSGVISLLVKTVHEEQAKAGCSVISARQRALLPEKLRTLVQKMILKANEAFRIRDKVRYIRVLQDLAWFTVQFRSLNRGAELSALKVDSTAFGPNKSCIIFQFTFTKTLRKAGRAIEFGVQERVGDPTCPVRHMSNYIGATQSMFGWDWETMKGAYVFCDFTRKGVRTHSSVTAQAMGQRFKKYLEEFGINDSEALHGLRAGGALTRALDGESLTEIMQQGFWKSPSTALHYIGMLKEVIGEEFAEEFRRQHGSQMLQSGLDQSSQKKSFLV